MKSEKEMKISSYLRLAELSRNDEKKKYYMDQVEKLLMDDESDIEIPIEFISSINDSILSWKNQCSNYKDMKNGDSIIEEFDGMFKFNELRLLPLFFDYKGKMKLPPDPIDFKLYEKFCLKVSEITKMNLKKHIFRTGLPKEEFYLCLY